MELHWGATLEGSGNWGSRATRLAEEGEGGLARMGAAWLFEAGILSEMAVSRNCGALFIEYSDAKKVWYGTVWNSIV